MKALVMFLVSFVAILLLALMFAPDHALSAEGTFVDVPEDHPFHDYIETLYQNGYVVGCKSNPLSYCPGDPLTRAQQAVFVIRGKFGASFIPPQPTEQIFTDVDITTHWGAEWIDKLYREGLTAGCSTTELAYCPEQVNTIAEGCTFMLKIKNGEGYVPPQAKGIFSDVSPGEWYEPWVEACYEAGILIPCATQSDLKACPGDALLRDYAAYMLVKAKDLPLTTPTPEPTSSSTPTPVPSRTPTPTRTPTASPSPPPVPTRPPLGSAIIVDHRAVQEFDQIPDEWLEKARQLTMHYAHTSHGMQILAGLKYLEEKVDPIKYNVSYITYYSEQPNPASALPPVVVPAAQRIADTGRKPEGYWYSEAGRNESRSFAATGLYDFSMFGWCGELSGSGDLTDYINEYLTTLDQFEQAYPGMRFIYQTGHSDGYPSYSKLQEKNDRIKAFVIENDKVLFDFADIENWDPDGNFHSNNYNCTWCEAWCDEHPQECVDLPPACDSGIPTCCPHSHGLNCVLKAKAYWWMMARLAGWDGTPVGGD